MLELRPGEEEWDGFLLDRRQLLPTGRETWEGVKVVIDAVLQKAQQNSQIFARMFTYNKYFYFYS